MRVAGEERTDGICQVTSVRNMVHAEVEPDDLHSISACQYLLNSDANEGATHEVFLLEVLAVQVFLEIDDRIESVVTVRRDIASAPAACKVASRVNCILVRGVRIRELRVVLLYTGKE